MSMRIPKLSLGLFKRKAATAPQAADEWSPTSYRWGLRQVRRRRLRNGKWEWQFPGQEEGERVKIVVHKHPWFLVKPALPVVAAFGAFFVLMALDSRLPVLHLIWLILEILAIVAGLAFGVLFVYKDFILWTVETAIVTNKRVITWGTRDKNFLRPVREVTPLEKVTQVALIQESLWDILLGYGTLHVYLTGGQVIINDIPEPRRVKDAITGVTAEFKAKKPPKAAVIIPGDQAMASLLTELGKPDKVDDLVDIDRIKYGPAHPDRPLGPRRTFGGLLRIPLDIHYSSGEFTVRYIQRSRWVLVGYLVLPVLLLLAAATATFFSPSWALITGPIVLLVLITIFLLVIRYLDDVYILTNKRIIDVDRKFVFFYETRLETEYKNIRDIKLEVHHLFDSFLDIGNLEIETPGNSPNIIFNRVDHPFFLQDKLYDIKDHAEKANKAKARNEVKEDLQKWFGSVITTLEQKLQNEGAPSLENLDFWSAADRASALGLHLVVMGEAVVSPGQPGGRVIQQSPPPGTLINSGGEIQVLLSKRA